jgi:hypothetical protein
MVDNVQTGSISLLTILGFYLKMRGIRELFNIRLSLLDLICYNDNELCEKMS